VHLLFDGKLAPVIFRIGFLEMDCRTVADFFAEWERGIQKSRGVGVERREISGSLEQVLRALAPLTSMERRRYIFVPTGGSWTAFFDNGHQGSDPESVISHMAMHLGCRGVKVVAIPDTRDGEHTDARGRFGTIELQVYGPEKTHFLNYMRTIQLSNQGDRWVFTETGTPFPFEDANQYKVRRVRERFSFELLNRYANALGLQPFDESFYLPSPHSSAVLFEKIGPANPRMEEYSFEDARRLFT